MTEAEKIYERFVNYEWNDVSDGLKESILKAINEALKQGQALNIQNVSNCDNPHCEDGVTDEIYGEKIYCSNCENK